MYVYTYFCCYVYIYLSFHECINIPMYMSRATQVCVPHLVMHDRMS